MKISVKLLSLFTAIILVLSGCGKNDEDGNKKETSGKAITLQMRQSDNFNPLSVTHHSVRDAFSLCYEPLFCINEKMEPDGVLARNINVSDDCLSAVITLKDSVVWHDGIKLTSGDVVHTINLLKENNTWEYSQCVKHIESAETIDPLSLRLRLSRPYGQIAYSLTFPIVAAHNSELDTVMLGTGPYRFKKYTTATSVEFERNDEWHGGDILCPNVTVSIIRDDVAATTAFNTGLVSAVTDGVFDVENTTPRANTRSTLYPSAEYEYMVMNHNRSIFASQTVRSAVSSAIDRTAIVTTCYGGGALAANSPVHPAAHGVAESSLLSQYSLSDAGEMLFLEGYSLDESTQILKKADGRKLSFELLVNEENHKREESARLLAEQLFAAGIEVRVTSLSFEDYSSRIESGSFDAYLGGTRLNNIYDFEFLLSNDGTLNNYGYDSDYMQLALSALCSAPGGDTLSDAVFNFEEVFLREQPVCGIAFTMDTLLTSENLMGKLNPRTNSPYRNIWRWSLR